jgi:16S rRNA (cytosine967-C5)-methyltransferase
MNFGGPRRPNDAREIDPARDRVCGWLAHQAKVFPDLEMSDPDESGLSSLDAAFAHAIYGAAIRRWRTLATLLDHVMAPRTLTGIDPLVRGVLLCGLAQVYFLDRVPRHSAIDEAVEWSKQRVRTDAGKFVNAVLRRSADLLRDPTKPVEAWEGRRDQVPLSSGGALRLREEIFPEDPAERAAAQCSIGVGVVRRWFERLGAERGGALALHTLVDAPIMINAMHAQRPFGPIDGPLRQHEDRGMWVFDGSTVELVGLLRSRPDVWVQDAASVRPVGALADVDPAVIVDLCAGRGTKTRQLASMFPRAKIVATDADPERLESLRAVFRGSTQVRTPEIPDVEKHVDGLGGADAVLLDVPCSNTGVFARRVEARYRLNGEMLGRLSETQRRILTRGRALVRPGGVIVYATCSVEPEENQEQSKWAASELKLKLARSEWCAPSGLPGEAASGYRDGSFFAVLAAEG